MYQVAEALRPLSLAFWHLYEFALFLAGKKVQVFFFFLTETGERPRIRAPLAKVKYKPGFQNFLRPLTAENEASKTPISKPVGKALKSPKSEVRTSAPGPRPSHRDPPRAARSGRSVGRAGALQ
jgi:hypothetical protein